MAPQLESAASSSTTAGLQLNLLASLSMAVSNCVPHYTCPNPRGKNQYDSCPPKDDPLFCQRLRELHRISTSAPYASEVLKKEYGITASARTVCRRWKEMGLRASKATEGLLSSAEIYQIVADHMSQDPASQLGRSAMKHRIALETGHHLKRETVGRIQKLLDPEGVAARHPKSRQIIRSALTSAGPNEVWCCDGHDKLCRYGFAIWGLRDKFSRKWLGLWVLPSNRFAVVVAYLWLSVIRDIGGIPIQSSSDCGTENNIIYGLANSLRDAFAGDTATKPAHLFLRSVHHIPIERGWLDFRKDFGHNFPSFWEGSGFESYDAEDPLHRELAMWLWPPIIQRELDAFRYRANNQRIRKQKAKLLPSGCSPNTAYSFPEKYGARDCLQPVDVNVIQEIMDQMQDQKDALSDWGVSDELAERAQQALDSLSVREVSLSNVWIVFQAILLKLRIGTSS